jgi:SAM-dependent methyltransferase
MIHAGAQQTSDFVKQAVPAGARILDVGCGDGMVARALADAGFDVTAIDGNENAIAETRARGINAVHVDFREFSSAEQFDVVLFARSLHHIHPLSDALSKAKSLATTTGIILIDDFGAELFDLRSAAWFYGLKSFLLASGKEPKGRGPKLDGGVVPADGVKHWRDHHFGKHSVSTSEEMLDEISRHFRVDRMERVPYLYRYFLDDVEFEQGVRLLEWERRLIATRMLNPIGIRLELRD